ncbi:hypothetical protein FDZ73_19860 [bacterium]|nr:MAG: hypothetical protein FDZ73_19860 [bacterium]
MTKTRPRQLELPVMVDINGKAATGSVENRIATADADVNATSPGFHKPASAGDQSIYKAISDNYFGITAKQA